MSLLEIAVVRKTMCSPSVSSPRSKESSRIYRSSINVFFQDSIINILHTNSMNIYPHKRNVDAPLTVRVIFKVVVFRTLRCVVARIALTTDCCCCWSMCSVHLLERGWMLSETGEERGKTCILNGTIELFSAS